MGRLINTKQKTIKPYSRWVSILAISTVFLGFVVVGILKLSMNKHNTPPLEQLVFNGIEIVDFSIKRPLSATNMSKQELNYDNDMVQEYMMYGGKKHLILGPYVLMDIETGEEIDLRDDTGTE